MEGASPIHPSQQQQQQQQHLQQDQDDAPVHDISPPPPAPAAATDAAAHANGGNPASSNQMDLEYANQVVRVDDCEFPSLRLCLAFRERRDLSVEHPVVQSVPRSRRGRERVSDDAFPCTHRAQTRLSRPSTSRTWASRSKTFRCSSGRSKITGEWTRSC